jgi:hypothetical protein
MLTPENLAWRRLGLGSSDARTVMNGTAEDWKKLRSEKLGEPQPAPSKSLQLLFDMGHAIEPVCLAHVDANVSPVLPLTDEQKMRECEVDPYFRANIDGQTVDGRVVECKYHTGDKSLDDLLEVYWPQLQHHLFVTDTPELVFAVVFGHWGRFDSCTVAVDKVYIEHYKLRAYQFRQFVETGTLPSDLYVPATPTIPRKREHVWPSNDNEVAAAAIDWITTRSQSETFARSKTSLKSLVPEDARSAVWQRTGSEGVRVRIDKAGKATITAIPAVALAAAE